MRGSDFRVENCVLHLLTVAQPCRDFTGFRVYGLQGYNLLSLNLKLLKEYSLT